MVVKLIPVALVAIFLLNVTTVEGRDELDFITTSSRTCRKSCINKYGNFCSMIDFSRGSCCEWEENDCGDYGGFCANDNQLMARGNGLEYWICPREASCGELI